MVVDLKKKPVVLFIPEAGIYPFMRGLGVLGDALKQQGVTVLATRCTGQMLRCPMLAMKHISADASAEERNKVCKTCTKRFDAAQKKYGFLSIELSRLVNHQVLDEINALVDNSECLLDIQYRGFPVGNISQYDFILETKFPYSEELQAEHKQLFAVYVKNTALTIALTDLICETYDPSLIITFNEYAQCQAVRYSAERHGVRRMALTYPVHFNVDASRFSLWEKTCEVWRYHHCQRWFEGKDIPIASEHVLECWRDSLFRMFGRGSHIFSSQKKVDPGEIWKKLKLKEGRKTIVVYTSSQDERVSVDTAMKVWNEDTPPQDAFSSQIEWLSMLLEYSKQRDDVQIVVRLHPREGAAKFGFDSKHLGELKQVFKTNTDNFIIIWPNDPVSSYDVMELADVCLVAWSLMGQEAARLGVPVLSFAGNMFYPDDDFIQVATNPQEYKNKLDAILQMDFTFSHLVKACRFYHWRTFLLSLDLSDDIPREFYDKGVWPRIREKSVLSAVYGVLSGEDDLIEYNKRQWVDSLPVDATSKEVDAVKKGIKLFIDTIFFPPRNTKLGTLCLRVYQIILRRLGVAHVSSHTSLVCVEYELRFSLDVSQLEIFLQYTRQNINLRYLVANGIESILVYRGKLYRRTSPLINRLAFLYSNANV